LLFAVLTIAFLAGLGLAAAQEQASGVDPTAQSVREEELLRQTDKLLGRITIPDAKLAVLEQPQGRVYQRFHERWLPRIGGGAILAMILALALFYATRGPIRLPPGGGSGRKILRFDAFERFTHWMTATSFILLAISGLNYFLGKRFLMPLLGPDAFATWSQWAKYAHNFLAWPFIAGVVFVAALWLRDNLPDRHDSAWLKAGGGLFGGEPPPAGRFNTGQKLIFWSVLLGGAALTASGVVMLFPFAVADIDGMHWAQYVHSIVGVVLIAIIIAHIYIGTIGMEGALDAMVTGEVDLEWARHHHSAWAAEQEAKGAVDGRLDAATPAE
jgi:formate dehydrogenase subunit gamma